MNYKRLGNYIREADVRNEDDKITNLLGINIDKYYMPSVANVVGTDLSRYKVVEKNQFACNRMHVGRDKRLPIALSTREEKFIVSPAYDVFEIIDRNELLPEYLMMWFSRKEFDRNTWFYTDADVRGGLNWNSFLNMQLPIPSPEKQCEIVAEYNAVQNRINLNNQLIQKLEETAQAIYKQWFVDFEFPNEDGKPYKSSGGEMVESELGEIPKGWRVGRLKDVCSKIGSGATPTGGKENYSSFGVALIRSMNVHDLTFVYDDLAFIDYGQAEKLKNVEIEERDVLLNITGVSVARCCMVPNNIIPARVNQHVIIIRVNKNISPYYLLLNLCSEESKGRLLGISLSGSTREAITKSEVENFNIIMPPNDITTNFEKKLLVLFETKNIKSKENNNLINIQSLLLSKMARG